LFAHWPIYPGEFDILVSLCNKYIIIFCILLGKECFNHDESSPNLIKEKTSIGRWKVRNKKGGPKVQKGHSIQKLKQTNKDSNIKTRGTRQRKDKRANYGLNPSKVDLFSLCTTFS
jgi:hypothetical protein